VAVRTEEIKRRRSRTASSWVDRHIRLLLVVPAVVLILLLTVFPLGYSLWVDFVNYDFTIPGHDWIGLGNFRTVWDDPVARHALWVTIWLSVACVAFELTLGLSLALAMVRRFRGRRVQVGTGRALRFGQLWQRTGHARGGDRPGPARSLDWCRSAECRARFRKSALRAPRSAL